MHELSLCEGIVAILREQAAVQDYRREHGILGSESDGGEEMLLLETEEPSLEISTDVSYPVELQEAQALTQQIERLRRLHDEGVIDEQEFAAAKARILG